MKGTVDVGMVRYVRGWKANVEEGIGAYLKLRGDGQGGELYKNERGIVMQRGGGSCIDA
jgi:hypothetical protein